MVIRKKFIMEIIRDGKTYKLTEEELSLAHSEFVINWMRKTLEEDFGVFPEFSERLAESAYEEYCKGDGKTEYECLEFIVEHEYLGKE